MGELRIRYNPVMGVALLVVGVLLVVFNLALLHSGPPIGAITGALLAALGVMYLVGTNVVVRATELEIRSPSQLTRRLLPIAGLADLRLEGDKVFRVSDGRKLANLGWFSCRRDDIEALRAAVTAATPAVQA